MEQDYYGELSLDDTEFFHKDRKRVVVIQPIKFEKVSGPTIVATSAIHETDTRRFMNEATLTYLNSRRLAGFPT